MKYKLELEEGELALIGSALVKLPYEVVAGLISKIGNQVQPQKDSENENC